MFSSFEISRKVFVRVAFDRPAAAIAKYSLHRSAGTTEPTNITSTSLVVRDGTEDKSQANRTGENVLLVPSMGRFAAWVYGTRLMARSLMAVMDKDGLTPGLAEIIDPSQTYRLR